MKIYQVLVTQTEMYSKVIETTAESEATALLKIHEQYMLESLADEKNTYQGADTDVELWREPLKVFTVEELFNIDEEENDTEVIKVEDLSDKQKAFLGLPVSNEEKPTGSSGRTFQVGSSGGSLEIDELTGKVLRCITVNDEDNELKKIVSFDVDEFRRYHGIDSITGHIDILDIGYTTNDNQYEPPVADWREEMRRQFQR